MAEAIIAVLLDKAITLLKNLILNEINLVTGTRKKVESLSVELKNIKVELDDAEERMIRDNSVKGWLNRLQETACEIEDVLDEWDLAILKHEMEHESNQMQKVYSFIPSPCLCFKEHVSRLDIAKKLENVKEKFDKVWEGQHTYHNSISTQPIKDSLLRGESSSFVDPDDVCGRENDKNKLVAKLITSRRRQEKERTQILSIVGCAGLGKTTLAQIVFNDSRVQDYFKLKIWVSVSNKFDETQFAKSIIEGITRKNKPDTDQLEGLLGDLKMSVSRKRFLLVLDDVRREDEMKSLKNCLIFGVRDGSKILVTTRKVNVAKKWSTTESDIYRPKGLSDEEGWSLLRKKCFRGKSADFYEKFQCTGKGIASKCEGFPIAIQAFGRFLGDKSDIIWENVSRGDSLGEIWKHKEAKDELLPYLLRSYNEMPPKLKRFYLHCAFLSEKYSEINVDTLIGNCTALGYMGLVHEDIRQEGRGFIDDLANRSLFQRLNKDDLDGQIKSFKMHNLVHSFAEFLRRNGGVEDTGTETTCQVSHVNESRCLFLCGENIPPNRFDSHTCLRVLGLRRCVFESIRGIENLIHLRWMDLSSHQLSREDTETISKLYMLQFLLLRNCKLERIPWQIGNLIRLRWLDLSCNKLFKEDTETICKLHDLQCLLLSSCELEEISPDIRNLKQLRHLDLSLNGSLKKLPESIAGLSELQTLNLGFCCDLSALPKGICTLRNLTSLQLDDLSNLSTYYGGNDLCKLRWLKKSNLSASLTLHIRLTEKMEQVVADAMEAELKGKKRIQILEIIFEDEQVKEKDPHASVRLKVIDALEPHLDLQELHIEKYEGSKLPAWITSPHNQLRELHLLSCNHLSSLPPLGKLPCLEGLVISYMAGLQSVGREFLGISDMDNQSASSSSSVSVATTNSTSGFPKLKRLEFCCCREWKEWEDITDEEDSQAVLLMPCLEELTIKACEHMDFTALPYRLLRKAPSLEKWDINRVTEKEMIPPWKPDPNKIQA